MPALRRLLVLALAVPAAWAALQLHRAAFPEAAVHFEVERAHVREHTDRLLRELGFAPEGWRTALSFRTDRGARNFLDLEWGADELEAAVQRGVRVFSWRVRYFEPGRLEELAIQTDPAGRLVGWSERIPETEERPDLEAEEARARALAFLAAHVAQHPVEALEPLEEDLRERPGHRVQRFTWERTDWAQGEAVYKVVVEVAGDRVSAYREGLDLPEAWERDFRTRRSSNALFQTLASRATLLLAIGGAALFAWMLTRREVAGRNFPLGWLIPVAVLLIASDLGSLPQWLTRYRTQDDLPSYLASQVFDALFDAGTTVVMLGVLAFVADALWSAALPARTPLRAVLAGPGLATRESRHAVGVGFALALALLAYQAAFYLAGRRVGIWAPIDVDAARVLTHYWPALQALETGVIAALFEELGFRVIVPLLVARLTGSRALGIGVAALVWGFLHSSYPQLPGWARGVELTAAGVVFGWAAFRYGILATLVAHCLFNTWLGAQVAWGTGAGADRALAVAVSIAPALLWVAGRWRAHRHGEPTRASLRPSDAAPPPVEFGTRAWVSTEPRRLSPRAWAAVGGAIAASLAFLVALPDPPLADLGAVPIRRAEARAQADALLASEAGVDPTTFRSVTSFRARVASADAIEYLLTQAEPERVATWVRDDLFRSGWSTRYFRPEEREGWSVRVEPDGSPFLVSRSIAETAPGAELESEAAVERARAGLARLVGPAAEGAQPVTVNARQREARRDWTVTFESARWQAGESQLRWTVSLLGDHLNGLRTQVKLPEAWLRERSARAWVDALDVQLRRAHGMLRWLLPAFLLALLTARRLLPWRAALPLAALCLALALARQLDQLPWFAAAYDTTQPWRDYLVVRGLGMASAVGSQTAIGAGGALLVLGLVRWLGGRDPVALLFGARGVERRRRWVEGCALGWLGLCAFALLQLALDASHAWISGERALRWAAPAVNASSPALQAVAASLQSGLQAAVRDAASLLVVVLLWQRRRPWLWVLLLLPLLDAAVHPDGWGEGAHAAASWALRSALAVALYAGLLRFNGFAYLVLFASSELLRAAWLLTAKAWPAYAIEGVIAWVALALPLVVAAALLPGLGRGSVSSGRHPVSGP